MSRWVLPIFFPLRVVDAFRACWLLTLLPALAWEVTEAQDASSSVSMMWSSTIELDATDAVSQSESMLNRFIACASDDAAQLAPVLGTPLRSRGCPHWKYTPGVDAGLSPPWLEIDTAALLVAVCGTAPQSLVTMSDDSAVVDVPADETES